jgi:hypothetical protein
MTDPWKVREQFLFAELFESLTETADEEMKCFIDQFETFEAETLAGNGFGGHRQRD